jgi:hypothetical protein
VKNEGSMGFTCGTMATDVKATDDLKGQGVCHYFDCLSKDTGGNLQSPLHDWHYDKCSEAMMLIQVHIL